MNMLKNEENEKYRTTMKNVLEFNPEILKRFVNFMNNPDEETAIAQFGKDDKYFGVCVMMVTMPGLPMFGHGQIEGFTEKYGMEYRRAYQDEQPDRSLIQRHEREIFPLMRRRHLFADVQNFLLYDCFTPEGFVNEDVFVYSNSVGEERALVVYHNRYATAAGWIRTSVAYSVSTGEGDERILVQKTIGEGLGLHTDDDWFCLFKDQIGDLEYIRNSKELHEKGLYVHLGAYKYHIFGDFREVRDNAQHHYAHLTAYLRGRGVPSIEEAMREIFLQPIHHSFEELMNPGMFRRMMDARVTHVDGQLDPALLDEVEQKMTDLLHAITAFTGATGNGVAIAREVRQKLEVILRLPAVKIPTADKSTQIFMSDDAACKAGMEAAMKIESGRMDEWTNGRNILLHSSALPLSHSMFIDTAVAQYIRANLTDDPVTWGSLLGWLFVHPLGKLVNDTDVEQWSRSWIDEWLLGKRIAGTLRDLGIEESQAYQAVAIIKMLTGHQRWFAGGEPRQGRVYRILKSLLKDGEVQQFLQINRYKDVLWFRKEAFSQLLWWMMLLTVIEKSADPRSETEILDGYDIIQELHGAEARSGYQVEKLLEAVEMREASSA
jgi:hypothetical protein